MPKIEMTPEREAFVRRVARIHIEEREKYERQNTRRWAYHEAGHALVALALGIPVVRVAIEYDGNREAFIRIKKSGEWSFEDHAMFCYAGACAQQRVTSDTSGNDHDFEFAGELVADALPNADNQQLLAKVGELVSGTDKILDAHWPKVEAVASALTARKSLTGDELWDVVSTQKAAA